MQNIRKLPSGRGIAGTLVDTWIINIYAPSGAGKRRERETFFNNELAILLPTGPQELLLAGEFNCVINPDDCTGSPNLSKALASVIAGLALGDVCDQSLRYPQFTHYTNAGATRIDRIYLTNALRQHKQGVDNVIVPFTDHLAVTVRLNYPCRMLLPKRRLWRMNISLLDDTAFLDGLMTLWSKWKRTMAFYPNKVRWWNSYVKRRISLTFQQEGSSRSRDRKNMEEFYYSAIYHAINSSLPTENLAIAIDA